MVVTMTSRSLGILRNFALLCVVFVVVCQSKVFTKCELGQVLLDNNFNETELGDWVCLADKCSGLNSTAIINDTTHEAILYGMFMVSNKFWCSDPDQAFTNECDMQCLRLTQDNLADTMTCARIMAAAKPGFGEWKEFDQCRGTDTRKYVEGCGFPNIPDDNDNTGQNNAIIVPATVSIAVALSLLVVVFVVWKYFVRTNSRDALLIKKDITLDKEKILGHGNFGTVYGGKHRNENVAFKTVLDDKSLMYELKVLEFLDEHPFIVHLHGIYIDKLENNKKYLVVDECPLGNLHDYLQSHRNSCIQSALVDSCKPTYTQATFNFVETENVTLNLMITWSYQIADAMEYLASKNVIHGDLAARNVLLKHLTNIKLSDFGLSKKLYEDAIYLRSQEKEVPWRWLPLEALTDNEYSTSSDVWSFGVTLWEIFTFAQLPYPDLSFPEYKKNLQEETRLYKPDAAPEEIYEIMVCCLARNREERPSFTRLKEMLLEHLSTNTNAAFWEDTSMEQHL